jgi:hypothetical protein
MENKTLMKDGRMKKVQMMVQPKLTKNKKKQSERNTSRKMNYEQQLLDILQKKTEHIDEDKTRRLNTLMRIKLED